MKRLTSILIACSVSTALLSLRPGAEWNLRGTTIEWLDKVQRQPTQAEIDLAILNCQSAEAVLDTQKKQAILDSKDVKMSPDERINALIKALAL